MYYYNSMTISGAVECVKSIPETFKRRTTLTKEYLIGIYSRSTGLLFSSNATKK